MFIWREVKGHTSDRDVGGRENASVSLYPFFGVHNTVLKVHLPFTGNHCDYVAGNIDFLVQDCNKLPASHTTKHLHSKTFVLRSPRGVFEAHLHLAGKPYVIDTIPSQTYRIVLWWLHVHSTLEQIQVIIWHGFRQKFLEWRCFVVCYTMKR